MESLHGRRALITGGAKRIGEGLALALARQGVDVVVHYNTSAERAEAVAEDARRCGVRAWTLAANLECPSDAEALMGRAVEMAGAIEILVNNASSFPQDTLRCATAEAFEAAFRLNALAPALIARQFAQHCRSGSIVNLLDARIADYDREHASYHVSKRALFTMTRMLAVEFAPGVRVNAVAPGLILPPEGQDEAYLDKLASTNPLSRHGVLEDVVEAALFLLRSDFVTGQVLFVDGGRHLRGAMYG